MRKMYTIWGMELHVKALTSRRPVPVSSGDKKNLETSRRRSTGNWLW